ncbi:MAG UNVERIFIED_CONTAM: hypothetical protein LVR29_11710 [Microcystis novacekii LVE1205-3]
MKTELKSIDRRLEKVEGTQDALIQDVSDLKGAKSLIIPVVVAVLTSILTLLPAIDSKSLKASPLLPRHRGG